MNKICVIRKAWRKEKKAVHYKNNKKRILAANMPANN